MGSLLSHSQGGFTPYNLSNTETVSDTNQEAVGDVLTLAVETKFPSSHPFGTVSVSGGGVTTWTKAISFYTSATDTFHDQELWWGTVTQAGSFSITATYNADSTNFNDSDAATSLDVQEFRSTAGASTVWSVDKTGKVDAGTAATTGTYPQLSPTSTAGNELYYGYMAASQGNLQGAGPTGVIFQTDVRTNLVAYDASVSNTIQPRASLGATETWASIGMLVAAANGSAGGTPPTVTGISPTSGPAAGGTTVTVTGTNFASGDTVKFGTLSASGVTVTSPTSLTAVSPTYPTASIRLLQSAASTSGSGSTRSVSLQRAVSAGNGLVLLFANAVDSATITSVTGGGVLWTRADQENDNKVTADLEIWYGLSSTGGSATRITVKLSASTSGKYSINLTEWAGLAGLDRSPSGIVNHTGSATAAAPSITPTAAGDLFMSVVGTRSSTLGSSGGGFTSLTSRSNSGFGYLVAADSATHQFSQALTSSASWDGLAVSFLSAADTPATVDVTVIGSNGTSATSAADQFTYKA